MLGWEILSCASTAEATALLNNPPENLPLAGALVELLAPNAPSGLEIKASLRAAGFAGPIILCSDADVLGYEFHGFAGALKRPYVYDQVQQVLALALPPA